MVHTRNNGWQLLGQSVNPFKNYIIVFISSDCPPCELALLDWHPNYQRWRSQYRLEIILVDLDGHHHPTLAHEKYRDSPFQFTYVVGHDSLASLDIVELPMSVVFSKDIRYQGITHITSSASLEYMFEDLGFRPGQFADFNSTVSEFIFSGLYCDTATTSQLKFVSDTLIHDTIYHIVTYRDQTVYLQIDENEKIIRFYRTHQDDDLIVNLNQGLCDTFYTLPNRIGQRIEGHIIDKYFVDGIKYLVTDVPIRACKSGDDELLTFIASVGTNAGLIYDVEDGYISSVLLCHTSNGQIKYRTALYDGNCTVDFTSIHDNPVESRGLDISPNPVRDFLSLEKADPGVYAIYQITGTWIQEGILDHTEDRIDVRTFPAGIYILQLTTDTGVHAIQFMKL